MRGAEGAQLELLAPMQPSKVPQTDKIVVEILPELQGRGPNTFPALRDAAWLYDYLEQKHGDGFLEDCCEGMMVFPDPKYRLLAGHYVYTLVKKPKGRIVDVHSYVGKEGLKARQYHAQRAATVQRVLDAAMKIGAVMVTGPPQSGKTSLLQLLARRAEDSGLFRVIYLDMADSKGNLEQALQPHGTNVKDLFAATRNDAGGDDMTLLLLDEAQHLYGKVPKFWGGVYTLQHGTLPGHAEPSLRVILASSYLCRPSEFAGGLLLNWDPNCTVFLDYNPRLDVALRLSPSDCEELISSFRRRQGVHALSDEVFSQRVLKRTGHQAGLITGLLDAAMEKQLHGRDPPEVGDFDKSIKKCLASGEPLASKQTSFKNFLDTAAASRKTQLLLGRLLDKKCKAEGVNQYQDADLWEEAERLYIDGHLMQREVDGEHHIGFISPLHRRFCAQHHGEAVAGV